MNSVVIIFQATCAGVLFGLAIASKIEGRGWVMHALSGLLLLGSSIIASL